MNADKKRINLGEVKYWEMSRTNNFQQQAGAFDLNNAVKREVEIALGVLKEFRQKYPFKKNLATIEWLDPDQLFKLNPDESGEFFRYLEVYFRTPGYAAPATSNIYRNSRLQIKEFRSLLRTAVDDRKSLAEKVDAPWERICGMAQDKQLAKKIIYCFNYEGDDVLPIFSNQHIRHFANRAADAYTGQTRYLSQGQEYQNYTQELLKTKNNQQITRSWNTLFFSRFLYATYPPPNIEQVPFEEKRSIHSVTDEQLDMQGFMKLLGELQKQGKISGEQFRENRVVWMAQPSEREALTRRLKDKLNNI